MESLLYLSDIALFQQHALGMVRYLGLVYEAQAKANGDLTQPQ